MVTNAKTASEKMQEILGTADRNKEILARFEAGEKKSDIARKFITIRGKVMSRQQVGEIIQMMKKAKEQSND